MRILRQDKPDILTANNLDCFFSIPPFHPEAAHIALEQVKNVHYPREWLSDLLVRYNSEIGNDAKALSNAKEIANADAFCVVTGQQLGYFGGPAYTILKGISCLIHARRTGAIPLYWLATEDHDIAEIDHVETVDTLGNLRRYQLTLPRKGAFVEDLVLTLENVEEIEGFARLFGIDIKPMEVKKGRSYSIVMAAFLANLFKGTGMLFIEPRLLREKAVDFLREEIEGAEKINELLQKTTAELIAAGGRAPLHFESDETNLFYKTPQGVRKRIVREGIDFVSGSDRFSKRELIQLIESSPENFSVAASARPVLQSKLIPTLAYVAGPSEIDYHRQLRDYFKWHSVPMPWVIPRVSMTFVNEECARYLGYLGLDPWEGISSSWSDHLTHLHLSGDSKENKQAVKDYLAEKGIPYHALHLLANILKPHGRLQERTLNWCWIQSQGEGNLILQIMDLLDDIISGHYYCFLSMPEHK